MIITKNKGMKYLAWFSIIMTATFIVLKHFKATTTIDHMHYEVMAMVWLIFAFVVHNHITTYEGIEELKELVTYSHIINDGVS